MTVHLQKELERLKRKILHLSALVEKNLSKAVKAVKTKNQSLADEVRDHDDEIDNLEVEVEEDCLKILALHQPVAGDLRMVVGILKMNNDLERIGDLAVNIAARGSALSKMKNIEVPFDIEEMTEKTLKMLNNSLKAFIDRDVERAKQVCIDDDEVDKINRAMYKNFYKEVKEKSQDVEIFAQYLTVSRYLERIADNTTNIAEDLIYMVEGKIIRHNPEILE